MTKTQEPLPTFEDEQVQQVQVRITNAGDGLSEALKIDPKILHLGDEFFCVLRGEVTQINHKQDDNDIVTRVHTVKASAITEVDGEMAKRILTAAADNLARAKAAREGQMMLEAAEELEREDAAKDAAIDEAVEVENPPGDDDAAESAPTPIFSKGAKAT